MHTHEPAGGQDVWHLHVHVFPRWAGDRLYEQHLSTRWPSPEERRPYADRLAADLQLDGHGRLGYIDVSFYRDDYARKGLHPDVKPTHIRFAVDGATVVLVDDVLQTGRTTRAAINVLFDYGRPACIKLAALADRGGRELPVAPDFVGVTTTLADNQLLSLARDASGQLSLTIEEDNADSAQ